MRRTRFYCHAARPLGPATLLLALLLSGIGPAGAQSVGWAPQSALIQGPYGDFYGTTSLSVNGEGTVFKMSPSGKLMTLHTFQRLNGEGAYPVAGLTLGKDGNFYGMTEFGGPSDLGTVFKMTSSGKLTTLYNFSSFADAWPLGGLTLGKDGNLYGVTDSTVFQITPSGTYTPLYSFTGGSDGADPLGLTLGKDGNFYGTTNSGGANMWGTVFKITPSGTLTTLYSFTDGNDGAYPRAGLTLDRKGNFYGATGYGGANQMGAIFRITPSGTFTPLYSFTGGSDGAYPQTALTLDKEGNFYGANGGRGATGNGVIFQMTSAGVLTPLYNFTTSGSGARYYMTQTAVTLGDDGNLYGVTQVPEFPGYGTPYPGGTIFQMTPSGAVTTLHTFTGGGFGWTPEAALTLGDNGSFYGTAAYGGANNDGTLFSVTEGGKLRVLHNFDGSDGTNPATALTQGKDRNFYGVTAAGGANGDGTIFKITPSGDFATLYNFTGGNDGANPLGALTLGKDGNFYGTAENDGAYGSGTVFKITPAGSFTVIYTFTAYDPTTYANIDGANPTSTLVLGKGGNLYGQSGINGGAYGWGTVFKITLDGTFTTLYSFTGGNDGYGTYTPTGALALGDDGNFYGTTKGGLGGTASNGTVFQVTPSGAFTTLYSFTRGSDGEAPNALTLGKDGNFYGTTEGDLNGNFGTVFQITPSGTLTTLYSFNGGSQAPGGSNAALTLGRDGNFYGTMALDEYFFDEGFTRGGIFQITPAGTLTPIWNF